MIVCILIFLSAILFSYIEFSSQFECLPNGESIPGVTRGRTPFFFPLDRQHSPEKCPSPPKTSLDRTRTPFVRRPHPSRSIIPPTKLPCPAGYGCGLDHLRFIRLIPNKNPHRIFELRRYTFPADKEIELRTGYNTYAPIPTQGQIVLSTSDGDIFAILESLDNLAGIYKYHGHDKKRAKINMPSGIVTPLNRGEINETPVGLRRQIMSNFKIEHLNPDVEHTLFEH